MMVQLTRLGCALLLVGANGFVLPPTPTTRTSRTLKSTLLSPTTKPFAPEYSTSVQQLQSPDFEAHTWTQPEVDERIADVVALGGTLGKGIPSENQVWPNKAEVLAAIPKDCFVKSTAKSLACTAGSLAATLACGAIGLQIPLGAAWAPVWAAYACITGTVAMGCWVLAHECGHGAFSDNKLLQDSVGFALHSALLVPYFSWQRSHAVHHLKTNHVTEGETHVPPVVGSSDAKVALGARTALMPLGLSTPASLVAHLVLGWPMYLLKGASGGPVYGETSHFWPWGHTGRKQLFPSIDLKRKVLFSDVGIVAALAGLVMWAQRAGGSQVALLYGGPLVVVNAWLVLYTWLQHTDVDVAHFDEGDHTWVKGAFQTIDRPYGGLINWLHHGIGSTHVVHHLCSVVPHYNAWRATDAIKASFPNHYLYDPTPVPKALLRVARHCVAAEKLPGKQGAYIYK